jgi:hypothetical protein
LVELGADLEYAYLDGDDVGRRLELLLLDDEVAAAAEYSAAVERARQALVDALLSYPTVSVIFSGGDDLMISFGRGRVSRRALQDACDAFRQICGRSISAGVGRSASLATSNLRRAKLLGKGRIVQSKEDEH